MFSGGVDTLGAALASQPLRVLRLQRAVCPGRICYGVLWTIFHVAKRRDENVQLDET